jgi:PAS domain S-box-containing protein
LREQLAKEIALSPDNSVSLRQAAQSYVLFGLLGTVLGSLVMVGILSRRINRRLAVISDNSKRLPQKLPLHAPLSGADEIAQLDKTFHQMAAALDAARKREQDAVENSADVIAALDRSTKIAKVSAAVSGWGFDAEALVGKPVSVLIPASESQSVSERLNGITQGDTAIQFESKIQTTRGETVDVLWSAQTSELDGLVFCVVHDITERKRMERLLQESAEREQLLNEKASEIHAEVLRDREERKALAELKQRLLAMIAGEIEAPLSALNDALEKFRAGEFGELSANGREKIEAGESEGKRLVRLFHDLVKAEAGAHQEFKLNFEPANLRQVIAQAAGAVQLQAEKAGVTITVDAASCERSVDFDRLVQVLVNLLSNAIKFANSGDTITLRLLEKDLGVEIRVSDQGRGIPEGMLDRVFDAFVQVEDSDASVKGGSGLGLAICRSIIERHGGKIWAEKNVGPGCTFVINFSS